ncbi:hypothetical protein D3C73_209330 [compost metagenome]
MSHLIKLFTALGPVFVLSDALFTRPDGTEVRASELVVGDTYQVIRDGAVFSETVEGIQAASQDEENEYRQNVRIAKLEDLVTDLSSRLETTENALESANNALLTIQRTIVDMTAAHIERLFNDQVMVDSLSQRFLIAAANAIAFKARASAQRTPELVVIEQAIPGAIRVTLLEEGGVLVEEQLTDTGEWVTGEKMSESLQAEVIPEVFGNLLAGYGASIGRPYYVVEDVHLETFRKDAQAGAKQALEQVAGAAAPVAEAPAADPAQSASEAPIVH